MVSDPDPIPQYGQAIDHDAWTVIRLDGRGFTNRTSDYARPFDPRFHQAMLAVLVDLMAETPAVAAHTASDEVSLVFAPGTDWYGGRLAKWLSVTAGVASASLTRHMTETTSILSTDAKIFRAESLEEVAAYLEARATNALRNARHGHVHFSLVREGLSGRAADTAAQRLTREAAAARIPPNLPSWQKHGVLAGYVIVPHIGRDPRTGREVATTRRVLRTLEVEHTAVIRPALAALSIPPTTG